MKFHHRLDYLTRLAFQFLWMGLAGIGLPPLALCIALYSADRLYDFLQVLHMYRLLWMFLLGIFLLIVGSVLLIWAGKLAAKADADEGASCKAHEQPQNE